VGLQLGKVPNRAKDRFGLAWVHTTA
jgi:sugar phosphate permease